MGRKATWPPKIYLHRPSGRARMRWRGKDYYLGAYGSEEAKQEYARLLKLLAEEGPANPFDASKPTWPSLAGLAERWLDEQGPAASARERAHCARAFELLLQGERFRMTTDRFGVPELIEVRADMIACDWCARHINRQITRIRTIWRWAEERRLAPPGSWAHLRTLRGIARTNHAVRQTPKLRAPTWEELQLLLARLRSGPVRTMLLLQWYTGMRSGEVRTMRACEVDTSGEVWIYRPRKHKNSWRGQSRTIPLGPDSQSLLAGYLKGKSGEDRVFLTRRGGPYSAVTYAAIVGRAARRAGMPWLRAYGLRHAARMRFTKEFSLEHARSMLGQHSLDVTLGYGDAIDLKSATEVARRCG